MNARRYAVVPTAVNFAAYANKQIGRSVRISSSLIANRRPMITTSAGRRRSLLANGVGAIAMCGIVALLLKVARAAPGTGAVSGEPVQTAMAFVVVRSMAAAIVTGLVGVRSR